MYPLLLAVAGQFKAGNEYESVIGGLIASIEVMVGKREKIISSSSIPVKDLMGGELSVGKRRVAVQVSLKPDPLVTGKCTLAHHRLLRGEEPVPGLEYRAFVVPRKEINLPLENLKMNR